MKTLSKLNKIHLFYGKAKYAFLIVFALTIMFSATVSSRVYGNSVVGSVETRITLAIDGKTKKISTTQNTIQGALDQNGITLSKNDVTEPPLDTYLGGKTVAVQVVRAVPVLIADNGQSWMGNSAYADPVNVLNQLEVVTYPEDKVSAELILDPATEGAVGQKVIINRAPVYTVYVDGGTQVLRSWTETVGDLLTEKGISLGVNDIVEPAKTASLAGVSEITITRINYADIEETISIPFQTVEQNDYNMYQGKSAVTQAGESGSKLQKLHIVYRNGVEVERTITQTTILKSPQTKIISIGVKPYSHQDLWNIMLQAQAKYGVDPTEMFNVMMCESGGNVRSGAGSAYQGLFQWDGSFYNWAAKAGYSGASIFDPNAQIFATALRVSQSGGWYAWSCKP